MAVLVTGLNESKRHFDDDEDGLHSYAVTDAGVLRVLLKQPDGDWLVLFEFSPSGWVDVQGTRYLGSKLDKMPGADGSTQEPPTKRSPMVVM